MISINAIWIFSLASFAIVAIILLSLILTSSSFRGKEFSFLRNFPYEYLNSNKNTLVLFKSLLFLLSGLAFSLLFVITPLISDFGDLGFLTIFITCIFGLAAIANMLLFFFDARYTKTHMALATVSMTLTMLANALATLLSILVYKVYLDRSDSHVSSLVLAIVSGLITLGMLFLIFNPKLTSWAKLESKENEDGTKTYIRGKVFVLALSEWITIALTIIGEIIFFVSILK